jgi:hypothetical protein
MMIDRERMIAELLEANIAMYMNAGPAHMRGAIASFLLSGFAGFENMTDAELRIRCKHHGIAVTTTSTTT